MIQVLRSVSSVTKIIDILLPEWQQHLTIFSAKIIYAEHICASHMADVPAHFSLKLVHSLLNCKKIQFTASFFTLSANNSILFSAQTSYRNEEIRLLGVWLSPSKPGCLFSYWCIINASRESHTSVRNTKSPLESGKLSLKKEDFFERLYISALYPLWTNFLNTMGGCSLPLLPTTQVDNFLQQKPERLFKSWMLNMLSDFLQLHNPLFANRARRVELNFSSVYVTSVNRRQPV